MNVYLSFDFEDLLILTSMSHITDQNKQQHYRIKCANRDADAISSVLSLDDEHHQTPLELNRLISVLFKYEITFVTGVY